MDYKRNNSKEYKLACPSYTPMWNKYKNFMIFHEFDKVKLSSLRLNLQVS